MAELERAYLAYRGELGAYLYARVGDRDTAEELLSMVFVEACERLPAWQDRPESTARDPLRAWLYRLAASRTVDHWRRVRRRRGIALDPPAPIDPEDRIDALDAAAAVRPALPSLPDRQRRVLQLRFAEGCSLEEVAAALGTSVGAIKALQHRALTALAAAIAKPPT